MQMVQRRLHRRGAEGAAADAQHHKGLELAANLRRSLFDLGHDFVLIVGQIHPALHALAAASLDHGVRVAHGVKKSFHLSARDAVLANVFGHHRVKIEANGLHTVSSICYMMSILYDTGVKFATISSARKKLSSSFRANFPDKFL